MATKTAATGNSGTAGTYTPSGVPTAADDVIVPAGVTLTLNGDLTCNTLLIQSGGGGNAIVKPDTTTTRTLTVANGITIDSTGSNAASLQSTGAGADLVVRGNVTVKAATSLTANLTADTSGVLTVYGDVKTEGAGTAKVFANGGTLNLPHLQAREWAATTNQFYATSAAALNVTMLAAGHVPQIKYPSSAAAGNSTINITPYGGDVEFRKAGDFVSVGL